VNLITNTDTSIFPYNTDNMVYDLDSRQYLLTVSGVNALLGENLAVKIGDEKKAIAFCLEISDMIYNFIYSYTKLAHIDQKRYQIAKDEDLRALFERILVAQMRYAIRSGANLLGDMHGVNIEKSKALNINSLRGQVEISAQALRMLSQSGLLFSGFQYIRSIDADGTF